MQVPTIAVRTTSGDQTTSLGRRLGTFVRPGEVLLLVGDLGTGKTTFVRGLAEGLGADPEVTSPTFTLVQTYEGGRHPLVHVDLYRTSTPAEVFDLGLDELFEPPSVSAVEWGEKAFEIAGSDYLECTFVYDSADDAREITLRPSGRWRARFDELEQVVQSWSSEVA